MTNPLAGVLDAARRGLELQWAADERRDVELTQAERYARDPIGWLNSGHVWIASKFGEGRAAKLRPIRLRLFPDQELTIRSWIDVDHLQTTGELAFANVAIEKSRQIGETWAFAAAIAWAVHYHQVTLLAMHVDGGEIDDGGSRNTVKSLFGKVRYIDQRLDRGKLPGLGDLVFRPFSREPAKIENPRNGAVVYGEGQTDNPGRGNTVDGALVDEAAFVQHGEKVYAALDEACPSGKALLSTVNGDDNFHARICDEKPQGWTYLRLHWSEHPVYREGLHVAGVAAADQPTVEMAAAAAGCDLCAGTRAGVSWNPREPRAHRYPGRLTSPHYDSRVIGKTDEQVANELDIDRERALGGRVYSEFQTDVHVVDGGIDIELDAATGKLVVPLELAWDFGLDATSIPVVQNAPEEVRVVGILEMGDLFGSSATPEAVAQQLRLYLQELGLPEIETTPAFSRHIRCVGDPAGQARSLETGKPFVNQYRRQGFSIGRPPSRLTSRVDFSIISVKRLLAGSPKPLRVCGVKAADFAAHMRNNVWPTDALGRRRQGATTPEDNIHNHACRAFAYWAVATFPPAGEIADEQAAAIVADDNADPPDEHPLTRRRRLARGHVRHDDDLGLPADLDYEQAL
ncbi:hypothetical protein Gocc_2898 [Gaiella occulta]|uniref:Uncharacterized protein n=1 Tax=Gaiella occulta TaxID=1002870 RepID=A0A7M2YV49_9ACTN|nr:hypothetical protein [Gaiella occulta]RDI73298.1 hypothetical protein Gocc_2898 [Gaiella occulta]